MTGRGQRKINTFFQPPQVMDQSQGAAPETLQPQQRQTNLANKLHLLNRVGQEKLKASKHDASE